MNILIAGSGAREHALGKALARSNEAVTLFCYGTSSNPGLIAITKDYKTGSITDIDSIIRQAELWQIDLAIIGPEAPLEQGLADALWDCRIPVIGPKKALAQIETSKAFARNLMRKYGIKGLPKYRVFQTMQGIEDFLLTFATDCYVIKANGLMGGKGVKVGGEHLHSIQAALDYCQEIFAQGHSLVIEEKLVGQEFSFMCFSDGNTIVPMPLVQDHKRAYNGDVGPNTGGMGSYSDADHRLPFLEPADYDAALRINESIIQALMLEFNEPYIGILYGGFMATASGVYVIEFNARFGDPEALNVLSILESDFAVICLALVEGRLNHEQVRFANKATVCKYVVPEGYPDNPLSQVEIDIQAVTNQSRLYLAAVNAQDNRLFATGSRTAAYVGVADTISSAEQEAEAEVSLIQGALFHRDDIGTGALINQRIDAMRRLRAR